MKQQPHHRLAVSVLALTLCVVVGACDSSSGPLVVEPPDNGAGSTAEADAGPLPQPPKLFDVGPPRGAWFMPGEPVTITGTVTATTGAISSIEVQGQTLETTGPTFSATVPAPPGINLVSIRVETEDGERTVDGRAFFTGDVHPVGQLLKPAVWVHLSPEFLDDDDPDLDDAAALTEMLVSDPSILAGLTTAVDTEYALLTPTNIGMESVDADVLPTDDGLHLGLTIKGLTVDFELEGKGGLGAILTGNGSMSASSVVVKLVLDLTVKNGAVEAVAVPGSVTVTVNDFDLQHDELESLGADLYKILQDYVEEYVTDTLSTLASEKVAELVGRFLEGFGYKTTFGTDPVIQLELALEDAQVASHGLNLTLSARVTTDIGKGVPFGPQYGALKTPTSPPEAYFSDQPVALAVDDDLINMLLFNYWYGGALTGIDLAPGDLAGVDLSTLPAVFQPLTRIQIDTLLPVHLAPRTLDDDDLPFELVVGDMKLRLTTGKGRQFGCSVSARTVESLSVDGELGAIKPVADTRPKWMQVEVGCFDVPPALDAGSVASLIRLGFPPLLRGATEGFVFALPGLPVSELIASDALKGQVLAFPDVDGSVIGPEGNLLLVEGAPILQPAPAE